MASRENFRVATVHTVWDENGNVVAGTHVPSTEVITEHLKLAPADTKNKEDPDEIEGVTALEIHWEGAVAHCIAESVLRYFENIDIAEEEAQAKGYGYTSPITDHTAFVSFVVPSVPHIDAMTIIEVLNRTMVDRNIPWRVEDVMGQSYRIAHDKNKIRLKGLVVTMRPYDMSDMASNNTVPLTVRQDFADSEVQWTMRPRDYEREVTHMRGQLPQYAFVDSDRLRFYEHAGRSTKKLTNGEKKRQRQASQRHSRKSVRNRR